MFFDEGEVAICVEKDEVVKILVTVEITRPSLGKKAHLLGLSKSKIFLCYLDNAGIKLDDINLYARHRASKIRGYQTRTQADHQNPPGRLRIEQRHGHDSDVSEAQVVGIFQIDQRLAAGLESFYWFFPASRIVSRQTSNST